MDIRSSCFSTFTQKKKKKSETGNRRLFFSVKGSEGPICLGAIYYEMSAPFKKLTGLREMRWNITPRIRDRYLRCRRYMKEFRNHFEAS